MPMMRKRPDVSAAACGSALALSLRRFTVGPMNTVPPRSIPLALAVLLPLAAAAQDLPAGGQRPADNDAGQFPVDGRSYGGPVHAGPSAHAGVVATLEPGTPVTVHAVDIGEDGRYQWMAIDWAGGNGWHRGETLCTERRTFGVRGLCD